MVAGLLDVPLLDLKIPIHRSFLPDRVVTFLHEADLRVSLFVRNNPICLKGFVPSNFVTVYHALRAITKANLASGNTLCEWGSGFGVVASLASMLEFKACGIEIQRGLVDASQELADDLVLQVEFVHGSFVPTEEIVVEVSNAENNTESCKLFDDADNAYNELGREPGEFDVVFDYPWPDEECLIESLFEKHAAEGALLMTYTQVDWVRLRRKVK